MEGKTEPWLDVEAEIVESLDLFEDHALFFKHDSGEHALLGLVAQFPHAGNGVLDEGGTAHHGGGEAE